MQTHEWQDSEQASGMRCISGASSLVPVQSMYECVCERYQGHEQSDSAVIGCLWEEAILLASVSMWISLTENMWKDVQMERHEERERERERVLLMSMASFIFQNPSPNQVSKEKQIAVKERRVEECKASPQQRECTKGVWGKDLFLGIWTVSFQAINKGTL